MAYFQAPTGKWELWEDEKKRVQYQPEFHPALENSVPDFSFADGTPQEKSSKSQVNGIH